MPSFPELKYLSKNNWTGTVTFNYMRRLYSDFCLLEHINVNILVILRSEHLIAVVCAGSKTTPQILSNTCVLCKADESLDRCGKRDRRAEKICEHQSRRRKALITKKGVLYAESMQCTNAFACTHRFALESVMCRIVLQSICISISC